MVHIAIGTKAQVIKMAPLILCLKQRGVDFNLIDLGQHSLITKDLREEYGNNWRLRAEREFTKEKMAQKFLTLYNMINKGACICTENIGN